MVTFGTVTVTFGTVVFSGGTAVVRACEDWSLSLSVMTSGRTAFATHDADISLLTTSRVAASQSVKSLVTSSAATSSSCETSL